MIPEREIAAKRTWSAKREQLLKWLSDLPDTSVFALDMALPHNQRECFFYEMSPAGVVTCEGLVIDTVNP